jgi:hypothetical protein
MDERSLGKVVPIKNIVQRNISINRKSASNECFCKGALSLAVMQCFIQIQIDVM